RIGGGGRLVFLVAGAKRHERGDTGDGENTGKAHDVTLFHPGGRCKPCVAAGILPGAQSVGWYEFASCRTESGAGSWWVRQTVPVEFGHADYSRAVPCDGC